MLLILAFTRLQIKCQGAGSDGSVPSEPSPTAGFGPALAKFCSIMTSLFPVWVIAAALSALEWPWLFSWLDTAFITNSLALVMLGMGLTLTMDDITGVFTKMPQLLLLGEKLLLPVLHEWAHSRLIWTVCRMPCKLLVAVGTCCKMERAAPARSRRPGSASASAGTASKRASKDVDLCIRVMLCAMLNDAGWSLSPG